MGSEFNNVQVVTTSARRKTLSVEVYPTGQVVIRAPQACSQERIRAVLSKRERWIAEQRAFFSQFEPLAPPRAWIVGESHLHLGRSYKLRIVKGSEDCVQLDASTLLVTTRSGQQTDIAQVESMVMSWRHSHAKQVFAERLSLCCRHYRFAQLPLPALRVQRLAKRWGSLSPHGTLTLHSGLVQAPLSCIDYVIFHELCHLIHPNHSPAFFSLLAEVCPNWATRKLMLETKLR